MRPGCLKSARKYPVKVELNPVQYPPCEPRKNHASPRGFYVAPWSEAVRSSLRGFLYRCRRGSRGTPKGLEYWNMFYVYILQSEKDKELYTGYTNDLRRRMYEHNAGKNTSTHYRLPLKLIYYEAYLDKKDALGRELFLKSGSGHRFIKKQLTHYLANKN